MYVRLPGGPTLVFDEAHASPSLPGGSRPVMTHQDPAAVRRTVSQRVLARLPELTQELTGRLMQVLRDHEAIDPSLQRLVTQTARNILVESMDAMPNLNPPPQARTVAAALAMARRLAEAGISANTADQFFHVAQAWWQDMVLTELCRVEPEGLPMELIGPLMRWQLQGFLGLADAAGQEHAAVLDSWRTTVGSALNTRVSFVLAEVEVESEAEDVLHYELSHRHLGLVIWSSRGQVPATRLRALVEGLAVEHGVIDTLVVPRDISSIFVWLALSGSASQGVTAVVRRASNLPDVRVAIGEPMPGLAGFKSTHEQALTARRMAQLPGSRHWRSIWYRDVAAAALLVRHPDDVEPWIAETLGELAGAGEDNERLRETLRVYLESGENATRAAGRLYVHRNTVNYRVARALDLLAVPLESHRLGVALALNYHHVALGNEVTLGHDAPAGAE